MDSPSLSQEHSQAVKRFRWRKRLVWLPLLALWCFWIWYNAFVARKSPWFAILSGFILSAVAAASHVFTRWNLKRLLNDLWEQADPVKLAEAYGQVEWEVSAKYEVRSTGWLECARMLAEADHPKRAMECLACHVEEEQLSGDQKKRYHKVLAAIDPSLLPPPAVSFGDGAGGE